MRLLATYRDVPQPSEEARRRMVRGKLLLKEAQGPLDADAAAQEIAKAIELAPWWWDAYYNLGIVSEKAGHFTDAIGCLKLYLLASPNGPDARAVQDKIYALELKAEKGG
jgi:predicted TPR repeat methyltransferase